MSRIPALRSFRVVILWIAVAIAGVFAIAEMADGSIGAFFALVIAVACGVYMMRDERTVNQLEDAVLVLVLLFAALISNVGVAFVPLIAVALGIIAYRDFSREEQPRPPAREDDAAGTSMADAATTADEPPPTTRLQELTPPTSTQDLEAEIQQAWSVIDEERQALERDRSVAAADRAAAESERRAAEADRLAATEERAKQADERAALEGERSSVADERTALEHDRAAADEHRVAAEADRQAAEADRVAAAEERAAAAEERASVVREREAAAEERAAAEEEWNAVVEERFAESRADVEKERESAAAEREAAAEDREAAAQDRAAAELAASRAAQSDKLARRIEMNHGRRAVRAADRASEWLTFTGVALDGVGPDTPAHALDELRDDVQAALGEVSARVDLAGAADPSVGTFADRLRRIADTATDLFGWELEFAAGTSDDSRPPDEPLAQQGLLDIAGEALDNAGQYSGAERVVVRWSGDPSGRHLVISDNGYGFDVAAQRGVGIEAMERTAELIGATFEITSSDDGGTTVDVGLPASR